MRGSGSEYAGALFALAREDGTEKECYDGLRLVQETFDRTPDISAFLRSPLIPGRLRAEIVAQAFSGSVPEKVLSLIGVLCEHNRADGFSDCVREYEALYRKSRDILPVTVISASELTRQEKEALQKRLSEKTGKAPAIEYRIDTALIAGMVVETGDTVMDGSVKTRLRAVKEAMLREIERG